jgi:hypothetical protein
MIEFEGGRPPPPSAGRAGGGGGKGRFVAEEALSFLTRFHGQKRWIANSGVEDRRMGVEGVVVGSFQELSLFMLLAKLKPTC